MLQKPDDMTEHEWEVFLINLRRRRKRGGVRGGGLAGAGQPTIALTPPAGFAYTPSFSVSKQANAPAYSHGFSMDAVKPTPTVTLYCGKGGDNANNGTTWALRVRSLKQLIVRIQAQSSSAIIRCLIEAATYRYSDADGSSIQDSFSGSFIERNLIIEPCNSSGIVLTGGSAASRRIVSLHDQTMPAWVSVGSSVYSSTYTTEVPAPGCFDLSNINSKGFPQALRYAPPASSYANEAAIIAGVVAQNTAFGQGACWIDTTNKKYYVRAFDGRVPDSSIVVTRGGINTNGANARNLYLTGPFGATQTVWARDLHLWGGCGLYSAANWNENRTVTSYFADSSFNYSCINGFNADGAGNHTTLRCVADDNYKDGFNYDQASGFDSGGTAVMRFCELDDTADWNGNSSQSDDSDNASSAHVRVKGVRVNVVAKRTLNRAFHDIAASQTWNLGCVAADCRITGPASAGFVSGFSSTPGETCKQWLDGCRSDNNAYDLEAYRGGTLYTANMDMTGYVNETANGGVITTYNSPPVLPGATGTLSATALSSSTVQLTFTTASGASSYEYTINAGSSWSALASDKIVTGLTQLTSYTFQVRGVNTDGNGPASNSAGATTPASATPTNILLNGDFSGGTTNWSGFGFSGKAVTGGKAVMTANPAFDGITQNSVPFVAGKYYDVTFTISGYSAGTYYPYFLGGTGRNGTGRSANGTFTERLLANTGNNIYGMQGSSGNSTLSIDDISVVGPYDTP